MSGYTKLFGSIIASTIWREDHATRIVWITMLAMANADGIVEASAPGLADLARVPVEDCRQALVKLSAPDADSRSKEFDGRRIEEVDGGWKLLNYGKYRQKLNPGDRREYWRVWKANKRSKASLSTKCPQMSTECPTKSIQADAEASAKADSALSPSSSTTQKESSVGVPGGTGGERPHTGASFVESPSLKEVEAYAEIIGLALWKAQDWFNEMEGCGWLDYHGRPIQKWQSVLTRIRTKWEADGRPAHPPSRRTADSGNGRPLGPLDLSRVIKAKQEICQQLRLKHCSEVAMGDTWNDPKAREKFFKTKREIKKLNDQLAAMA